MGTRKLSVLIASTILASVWGDAVMQARAQSPQSSASQTVQFQIGSQSLSSAVDAFSAITGWQVGYPPESGQTVKTRAVSGTMTPVQALQQMTSGTGLTITVTGPSSAAILSAEASNAAAVDTEGTTVLGVITVQGQGAVTEGTGAYTADWMRTANGLALSQQQTPQSTSVVTRQMIEDRGEHSVKDVLENATGVTTNQYETDRFNFYSRGFEIDNYQFDGIPTTLDATYQYGDGVSDTVIYDHVEVVRGATGLLQGIGQPGASINFIRKRPTDTFQGSVTGLVGTNKNYRTELDLSGPINKEGTVRGRFVGALQSREDTIDYYNVDKGVFYGVIEADISESTKFTVGASHQKTDAGGTMWGGLPAFDVNGDLIDWAKGSGLGTDWTGWKTNVTDVFTSVDHTFENGWEGRIAYAFQQNKFDAPLLYVYGNPDLETGLGMKTLAAHFIGDRQQHALTASLNGDYELFGREHEFVIGAYGSHSTGNITRYAPEGALAPVGNVFDWDGTFPEPIWSSTPMATWYTKANQVAIYGATRLHVTDDFAITLGGRLNYWDGLADNTYNYYKYKFSREFSPYVGATYDLNDNLTLYASYTTIFKPQQYEDVAGNYLDPVYGHNYEVGIKGSFLNDRLKTSLAFFQTNQKGLAEYVAYDAETGRSFYRSIDGTETKGVEAEIAGEVYTGWNLFGGITYRSSKDNEDNDVQTFQPKTTVKLGTTYKLPGQLEGMTVGAAMRWQSKTENLGYYSSAPSSIVQKSYAVFDMMASYDFDEKTSMKLNVYNVFDERYYRTMGFYDSVFYGDGRSATLSLKRSF